MARTYPFSESKWSRPYQRGIGLYNSWYQSERDQTTQQSCSSIIRHQSCVLFKEDATMMPRKKDDGYNTKPLMRARGNLPRCHYGPSSDWTDPGIVEDIKASQDQNKGLVEDFLQFQFLIVSSKKQETLALSSAEAEYAAVTSTAQQALWLRKLLVDFDCEQKGATEIFCDKKSSFPCKNEAHRCATSFYSSSSC
ncbi:hypothetical protein Tco_0630976 [Tanacetum coccineum]